MLYDLTSLTTYLEDTTPDEIAKVLDDALYDLVLSAEYRQRYDELGSRYLDLMLLRNQFIMIQHLALEGWR